MGHVSTSFKRCKGLKPHDVQGACNSLGGYFAGVCGALLFVIAMHSAWTHAGVCSVQLFVMQVVLVVYASVSDANQLPESTRI